MGEGKQGVPVWAIVLIAMGGLLAVSVAAPLAIYGIRKYMQNAKQGEASAALVEWGDGLVRCAERDGKLPPSTTPVPASLTSVAAHKYQSTPTDWSEPAHTCAGFKFTGPQYFQYTWALRGPTEGVLDAQADLDGDGNVDMLLELAVTCSGGKCERGQPIAADGSTVTAGASEPATAGATASSGESKAHPLVGFVAMAWIGICLLVLVGASIALVVVAFQESVGWGLVALLVPCGRLVFLVKHWERAKVPFFWQLGSFAAMIVGGIVIGGIAALFGASGDLLGAAPAEAASADGDRPAPAPAATVAPVPIPALDGTAVDLSTVMGRARKLANAWEPDAALLGVEATLLNGKVPTQDGATATVTFGPSPFETARPKSGLFVVTYDKSGIAGAAVKGNAGKALPEPMCAPEGVLPGLAELVGDPIKLSYGLDGASRPAWLVSRPGDPKPLRAFGPDDCSPRGLTNARPQH